MAEPFSDDELKLNEERVFYILSKYRQLTGKLPLPSEEAFIARLERRYLDTIDADRKKVAELEAEVEVLRGEIAQKIIKGYKLEHEVQIDELKAEVERLKGNQDHPEHYCHRCGGRNMYSWNVDSEIWNDLVRSNPGLEDKWGGIICPSCLDELDREKYGTYSVWHFSKEKKEDSCATDDPKNQ